MILNLLFFVLCTRVILCQIDYESDDSSCFFKQNNTKGACLPLVKCPQAYDELKKTGIQPTTCRFDGKDPVVCCKSPAVRIRSSKKD